MAHPPLQPRPRLREADGRDEAGDPGRGEARRDGARERIELKLRSLAQLFHSLDPSPFRERELDATAEEFIVDWASDLPRSSRPELVVHLAELHSESDEELSGLVSEAVHNHFLYRSARKRHELRALLRRGRLSLLIGLAFSGGCIAIANWVGASDSPLNAIARESLVIGGWVAMWRPLEIFLYDWWEVRRWERDYARLAQMSARVVCLARPLAR